MNLISVQLLLAAPMHRRTAATAMVGILANHVHQEKKFTASFKNSLEENKKGEGRFSFTFLQREISPAC
jgi:hypothetical protein